MSIERGRTILEVHGITKAYGAGSLAKIVLHGVSFAVAAGELAAICGPSGSGKTTLLNIIGTLDRADSGEIWLDGDPLHLISREEHEAVRRCDIGFVFQELGLLPNLTARENVEMALLLENGTRASRRARANAALASVGLHEHAGRFPHELSGGQKQRVGIARAIVKRPKLVIADEPTANLDSQNAFALISLIRALAQSEGTAFLIATHDARLLEAATSCFTLRDGVLTLGAEPPAGELRTRRGEGSAGAER